MLEHLEYSVKFSNGKTLKVSQALQPGLTLITGANETGKSVFMEMILFALFGTECLRGPKDDYAELKATVVTNLFTVTRSLTSAQVHVGGVLKAGGQQGATKCVTSLLGFGVSTFLVTCAVRQGEVEALGKMRPTARKAMVEDALGIKALHVCEKHVRKRIADLKTSAAAIQIVIAPTEDIVAIDHTYLARNQQALADQIEIKTKHDQAQHTIRHLQRTVEDFKGFPSAPEGTIEEAEKAFQDALDLEEKIRQLRHTIQFLPRSNLPYTEQETNELLARWQEIEHWKQAPPHPTAAQRFLLEREWYHLNEQLQSSIECPSCGVEFNPSGEIQTAAAARLKELDGYECRRLTDDHRYADVAASRRFWGDLEEAPLLIRPAHTAAELRSHLEALPSRQQYDQFQKQLLELRETQPDVKGLGQHLSALRNYQQAYDIALAKQESVDRAKAEIEQLSKELCTYAVDDEIARLKSLIRETELQIKENDRIASVIENNEKLVAQVQVYRAQMDEYAVCLDAINNVRDLIKASLAPELSSRASVYMSQLTGSSRNVVVDADMDVKVDGIGLHALSGSAKACADLSLRFALAGAMTQKVFPVLLCDEPDAAFDEQRGERITQLLQTISQQGQVIMISHKEAQADRSIVL